MIGFLRGKKINLEIDHLLLDVQGVGYELWCSGRTLEKVQSFSSSDWISFWIHTHVREDQLQLFGFLEKEEKNLFLSLIKVNGIGPKVAMGLLSKSSWQQIFDLIERGDAKALSSLPKIGKKTAEQIILTLQGKLIRAESSTKGSEKWQQISFALVNLGFKSQVVETFVGTLPTEIEIEEGVRLGLQSLSKNN